MNNFKLFFHFVVVSIYSFLGFCTISFFSVLYSLSNSVGELSLKPVVNIGFPFKFYYQFWLNEACSPNAGWQFDALAFDILITWISVGVIYFLIKKVMSQR